MKTVLIKGKEIASADQLHDLLARELELPDHYGRNLDALWDCLTGWVELPLEMVWEDFAESRRLLGDAADAFLSLFRDAEQELGDFRLVVFESGSAPGKGDS